MLKKTVKKVVTRYPAYVNRDLLKEANEIRLEMRLTWPVLTEKLLADFINSRKKKA